MATDYKRAAFYQVQRQDGTVLGRLKGGVYQLEGVVPHAGEPYSGLLRGSPEGDVLTVLSTTNVMARREGLQLVTPSGERWQMVQIRRPPERPQFDDPWAYRARRDLVVWMTETGHPKAELQSTIVGAAPFDPCPRCNDRYGYADVCEECGGWGFVPEVR